MYYPIIKKFKEIKLVTIFWTQENAHIYTHLVFLERSTHLVNKNGVISIHNDSGMTHTTMNLFWASVGQRQAGSENRIHR